MMNHKIRVIYDISVLGDGTINPVNRTGVYRVVENILFELMNRQDVEILLYPGMTKYWDCLRYIRMHKRVNACKLHSPRYYVVDVFFGKSIDKISFFLDQVESKLYRYWLKLIRKTIKLSYFLYVNTSAIWEYARQKKIFIGYDVFHGTYYPIPDNIKKIKSIKHFTTIFDLIPILFPGYFVNGGKHPLWKIVYNLKSENYLFCISKSTKNDLCACNNEINPNNVFVTYLAASDNFYIEKDENIIKAVKKKYHIPIKCKYMLALSTIEPRKNINLTINSFIQVISTNNINDLVLVLAGAKGWEYDSIFEVIEKHSYYRDKIILTGYVDDKDLAPLYSGAMVFVYPSFYEGFGLPPLEAMQCGTPVITSNTSSLPEVVGDVGIMIEPTDLNGLVSNILRLYHYDNVRDELSKKSLLRAKEFSWAHCADSIIAAYNEVLSADN